MGRAAGSEKRENMKTAAQLHSSVPPDWYHQSIKQDPLQRYWHGRRFEEVGNLIESADMVLDIGSADGVFTSEIAKKTKARKVIGIDVLKTSVAWANKHWKKNKKIRFQVGDIHDLKFKANSFDAIFALEVLEHVFEPEKALREIKRVLKKGGYAIFLVPSENLVFKTVWFLWHFYGRMVWEDTHVQQFSNNSLTSLSKQVGFKIVEEKKFILGMLHAVKVRKP